MKNEPSLHYLQDEHLGLKAVLAVDHLNDANISIGGCRVWRYNSEQSAIFDAVQLARNMSLKYRVVQQRFGGLKLVVYELNEQRRKDSFRAIGEWLNQFDGRCYIATDVGSTHDDMTAVKESCSFVVDLPEAQGGFGSFVPLLTKGVLDSLNLVARHISGQETLCGLSAYVHGLGKAGYDIAGNLIESGCTCSGWDTDEQQQYKARDLGLTLQEGFLSKNYDLFVPCSVGHVITPEIIRKFRAHVVGGAANRPLAPGMEQILCKRNIVYVPDFVISAGAIVVDDLLLQGEIPTMEMAMKRVACIGDFTNSLMTEHRKNELYSDTAYRILDVAYD
jgi:glutamate dehydrogenase/leucine dehydrogenase